MGTKFYKKEQLNFEIPNYSIYKQLELNAIEYKNHNALNYFGKLISYEELINLVETINKKDLDVLSEKEIDELMTELINKMVKLEVMASDLALLNSLVAEAETLNKEDYTAESYAKLSTVLLKVKQKPMHLSVT